MVELAKDLYRARYLFRSIPEWCQPILGYLLTMLPFNYIGTLHFAKDYTNGMMFLGATYWYVIIIGVASLTLSRTLGLVKYA